MATTAKSPARLRIYLALLRPANVVTALADILAGTAIVGAPPATTLPWLLPSTACLYAGGIVLNDYFDRELDRVERPERPIPSGHIAEGTAARLGTWLLALGIAFAFGAGVASGLTAVAIAAAVGIYDAWGKHHPFLGPLNMGACRALNLLLGMSAMPGVMHAHVWLTALPLTYITGVTVLSRGEVGGGKRPVALLALTLVAGVLATAAWVAGHAPGDHRLWALALAAVFAGRVLPAFLQACRHPSPGSIRLAVRAGVLSLVLLDAVFAATYAGMMMSVAVIATALLASWLARAFAVT